MPLDRPQQLWLDVDRPIQPRPRRAAAVASEKAGGTAPIAMPGRQIEMRMTPRPAPAVVAEADPVIVAPPATAQPPRERPPFGAWLLAQTGRKGNLGALAKAAGLDRSFPKSGTADAVRARFSAAGADGDAFEALEDAEREYDRVSVLG